LAGNVRAKIGAESEELVKTEGKADEAAPRIEPTGCCPPFDPSGWSQETLVWRDKLFVTDHVHCVLHVPIDMGRRVVKNGRLIEAARARPERPLMLSTETSAWGAELYIEVTQPVPGARMTTLSGTFSTKVYEGPYQRAGKWIADMRQRMAQQGQLIDKLYLAYMTCPRCAKAYGKNYVIVFAQHANTARSARAA
jgi:hypothetical protein